LEETPDLDRDLNYSRQKPEESGKSDNHQGRDRFLALNFPHPGIGWPFVSPDEELELFSFFQFPKARTLLEGERSALLLLLGGSGKHPDFLPLPFPPSFFHNTLEREFHLIPKQKHNKKYE